MGMGELIFNIQNRLDENLYDTLKKSNKESKELTAKIYDLQKIRLHSMQCENIDHLEKLRVEYLQVWDKVKELLPPYESCLLYTSPSPRD